MLLFLTVFVAGCAGTTDPVTRTVVEYRDPPAALYPDCEPPEHNIDTNRDLARGYRDLHSRLEECSDSIRILRNWRNGES